jgi:D-proline reductase (dithiol) PrdB
MKPVAYVERLNARYRKQGFPPYKWSINETALLTRLAQPLNRCRVALLTSGGVSHCDAKPFEPLARNNLRLDALPEDTPAQTLVINDGYYNHLDADRDINCIFPIDRLRELAAEGIIGFVASHHYSGFMGRIYMRSVVVNEAAPAFARRLSGEGVHAAVLVPA